MYASVPYPNRALNASSTFLTGTNSIFSFVVSIPCRLYFGNKNRLKPNFSASPIRCSIRFTGRISPDNPISPAMQTSGSMAASILEERIALIRSWQEPDDCVGGSGMDLFDMYDAYIRGEKEIAEINGEFQASYVKDTEDLEQPEEAKSTSGELTQLTKLHAEGALTDEEFAAAKKKVLGL